MYYNIFVTEPPPSYPDEKPPAYGDVCPTNISTVTSPPSYNDTIPSQDNNNTSNAIPSPVVAGSTVPQSVVISQPGTARPIHVVPYNHQVTLYFTITVHKTL